MSVIEEEKISGRIVGGGGALTPPGDSENMVVSPPGMSAVRAPSVCGGRG